ncbi:uncharacterized protein LOC108904694 [Anoplophora glabripennis]|uniref:uncharacterized protein LOC108904694 n=1 Tax=Anoplophora glabripennis TaxID=217634 RepID=UPI000875A474|nr:uncharacterized protein LOC108904694 [Anoplophora glabripennis]
MKNTEDTDTPVMCEVELAKPKFIVHKFVSEITEHKIVFQVIKMIDSLFIYINDKDRLQFSDLSFAMTNRYDKCPTGTTLIGNFSEEVSKNIACRISKKVNKAVYLSCNVEQDRLLIPLIEKRLYEEIKSYPDKF